MVLIDKVFSKKTLMACLMAAALAAPAYAANETSCDPEYMEAMNARALMEARREVAHNQAMIVKPDSVLEYSCFKDRMTALAANESLFSNTVLGAEGGLGPAMKSVGDDTGSYLQGNYSGLPYGGRAPNIRSADLCVNMNSVWIIARDYDFAFVETDGFHDFDWYTTEDPRVFPSRGGKADPVISTANLATAYNGADAYKKYVLPDDADKWPPAAGTPYGGASDAVATYLNKTLPVGTGPAKDCANPPIKTGVKVAVGGSTFDDAVCPNPGCYHDGKGACVRAGQ